MNILIIGCGKTGARIADVLFRQGHDVSILDQDMHSFDALPPEFNGFTTHGVPIDRDNLKKAGIESCEAVIAVTQDDNINIMVAQMATELFHIKKVLTRVYDPKRGEVFSRFGLHTICPTNLTVSAMCNALTENTDHYSLNLGNHNVSFAAMEIPPSYEGRYAEEIVFEENEILFAVERGAKMILVGSERILLKRHDKLIFAKAVD